MIISLNWIKKFTKIDLPVDELIKLIGARIAEVEEVVDLAQKYKNIIIARVVESNKMPDSDHLSIVRLDDGGIVQGVDRDQDGYVQVVCGAPNMRTGITVVWLPPKTVVPNTFKTASEFILDSRSLRGYISNGMIASARELDISDDHSGILELGDDIKPGTSFTEAFELDDYLLTVENKPLTRRPDCFGVIGFAREVSAISGQKFSTPDWLMGAKNHSDTTDNSVKLEVTIDDPVLSPRYLAIVLDKIDQTAKSPLLIQTYLSRSGIRPINAVVDVTNYLMLLTGQPLHAFDYDKLLSICGGKSEIHVRSGHQDEKLELLDGKIINLTTDDIVIAAGDTAVALAGAMGGKSTAIDENTSRVVIESASFNLYNLRGTQMRHGIFTEAITRFTKGQSAEQALPVINKAVEMVSKSTNARPISQVIESYPGKTDQQRLDVAVESINATLGSKYLAKEIKEILERVEFSINADGSDKLEILIPYWRNDIDIAEDVAEEVGRIAGFDNIADDLPKRDFIAVRPSDFDLFRTKLRKTLVKAGANEVLTYSFIHGDILKKASLDEANSYRLINSLSPDLQYCRQTLTPSLLNVAYINDRQGYDRFAVFELNKVHEKADGMDEDLVPIERNSLALVFTDKNNHKDAPYYQSKKIVDFIASTFNIELTYSEITDDENSATFAPFEKKRSAKIIESETGKLLGVVGEFKSSVVSNFKLSEYSSGFEINTNDLFVASMNSKNRYKPLSRYPSCERDICFKVQNNVNYSKIIDCVKSAEIGSGISYSILPIDIFMADGTETKNITIRVKLTSHDHTLTGEEVANIVDVISSAVINDTGATVV